ncbi:DUF6094 domain-containing protein [Caldanaerobacter subterraneus]|uniref:Class I SAM-dependent methyltransferase n=1 Tax=Caldanaerobacter subterraneus TaxID=911092 RepID=A0A7Y2L613_9THEO|nr:DUF6094 domain-containing protein [Caldanaerobacter subterraneus]NNG66432.1 class I SAM-dependent methyltransferase [Caldanaerobacter subterraneus]
MRFEGQYKMGYYPTPLSVVERIKSFINFPDTSFSMLDPCCGCGTALQKLAEGTKALTYGIELDEERYKQAKEKLYRVAKGGYEIATISNEAFSVLFLNPPYDFDTSGQRKEKIFLQDTQKYLIKGGLLIYIIPQERLTIDIAKFISYRFTDIKIYRFPEEEYKNFRQIVLFGVKKKNFYINQEDVIKMVNASQKGKDLEELPYSFNYVYSLPPTPKPKIFRSGILDKEELEQSIKNSPLWDKIREYVKIKDNVYKNPPLPLHQGHIGLLLASGYLNGEMDGHLIKGSAVKKTVQTIEEEDDYIVTKEKEIIVVTVKVLTDKGEIFELI